METTKPKGQVKQLACELQVEQLVEQAWHDPVSEFPKYP